MFNTSAGYSEQERFLFEVIQDVSRRGMIFRVDKPDGDVEYLHPSDPGVFLLSLDSSVSAVDPDREFQEAVREEDEAFAAFCEATARAFDIEQARGLLTHLPEESKVFMLCVPRDDRFASGKIDVSQ